MTLILGKRWGQLKKIIQKNSPVFSALNFSTKTEVEAFKTPELHPGNHTKDDLGLFYTIQNSVSLNLLFKDTTGLPHHFVEECKTFGETPFLIRKPALEIINCLKNTDHSKPINKYFIYGKYGSGKTITIAHVIHYAYMSGYLIVHVPRISLFGSLKTEVCDSPTMTGFKDLPTLASGWLMQFKNQNIDLIKKLDLRISNTYKWNIQEENNAGDSLLSLVDHGITRGKYSCEVINVLMEEIKLLSKSGIVKTLLAIDEFSAIFHPAPKSTNPKRKNLSLSQISFIRGFQNLAKADWNNGAAILSCNAKLQGGGAKDYFPLTQLTREGFEFLDPFIPIEVPHLTKKEMTSILTYYRSKKWLLTSEGDHELQFLSGGNALTLKSLCAPL